MNKLRNFLAGVDLLLLCMAAGYAAERGVINLTSDRIAEPGEIQVLQNQAVNETDINNYRQDEVEKKVALTFDDGPNTEYTEELLRGLKKRGVKATFFLLGKEVEKSPALVEEIYKDGHLIGNHSYEHVDLSTLSDEAAILQVDKTNEAIYQITGEYPEYIRPPFGCWKCNLDYETEMIEVLWDVDPRDWETEDAGAVTQMVVSSVRENDIILLHDASESSVSAAFAIIDELQRQGYTFVTVDEILFD